MRSDGAGIVVLKPLTAALKNGDPIYAVIRGSAVNQNGASNGVTAPSRAAQEQVLREAYAKAKVSPAQIQYVETQGTGTPLGDTIEALALGSVLGEGRSPGQPCAIGSVKTNIGHTEAASGIASLMKVALALKHGQLPPSLHFQTPNPDISFERLPLRVLQQSEPWPRAAQPRLAGVSAFGFGGSNAHVVLEQAPDVVQVSNLPQDGPLLLPLSARSEKALHELARRYVEFLDDDPPPWRDVCYTAAGAGTITIAGWRSWPRRPRRLGSCCRAFSMATRSQVFSQGENLTGGVRKSLMSTMLARRHGGAGARSLSGRFPVLLQLWKPSMRRCNVSWAGDCCRY